jgi:hypothetical protein
LLGTLTSMNTNLLLGIAAILFIICAIVWIAQTL